MLYLLPMPQRMTRTDETFALAMDAYIVLAPGAGPLMRTAAQQLRDEIRAACGIDQMVTCGRARPGDILLAVEARAAQSFRLESGTNGVTVRGGGEAGVLHGAQTLRQIIRQSGWTWPGLDIEDAPAFPARGFYHDQTRGRIGTMAWLKQLADEACLYKLNQLQLYVEHTYLYRDIPELWATAVTPLTPDDILELDDYCAARGIELVPSLSSFGHLFELLRTKRFSPLCELADAADYPSTFQGRMAHHTIAPSDERSFPLIASMIDEYMVLFRTDKFNICCDETFDLGKGKNAGKDVGELYMGFLKKLCAHVAAQGKTPMFWGDIVLKHPGVLSDLPAGAICLNWGYGPNETEDATRTFAEVGAVQYVCPGTSSWNWFIPLMDTGYRNIRCMAAYGRKHGAQGLLNTDWGDYGHVSDPRFSLPGMICGACASWGDLPEEEALHTAISCLTYGDRSGRLLAYAAEAAKCPVYGWWHSVAHKEWARKPEGPSPMPVKEAARMQAADMTLDRDIAGIKACMPHMDAAQRPVAACLVLAAEGIKLWNHVCHAVAEGRKDGGLALCLERWLYRYEAMWRETSRESEMWRIRDVAVWYADQLR